MTHRVTTGTPVNLKERIAALQQRAASASPQGSIQPSSSFSNTSTPTSAAGSPGSLTPGSASNSALRDRIAKFEQKGGVPVPRGSFGLGAPPPKLSQTHEGSAARKKGELYGNRIASINRASPSSPPSATVLRQQRTGNGDVQLFRSLSPGPGELGDGSPVRKRCLSTSGLEGIISASAIFPSGITSGSFDEGENFDTDIPAMQLFASNGLQSQASFARRNSISSADAMHLSASDPVNVTLSDAENGPLSPQSVRSPTLEGVSEVDEVPGVPDVLSSSIDDDHHSAKEDHQISGSEGHGEPVTQSVEHVNSEVEVPVDVKEVKEKRIEEEKHVQDESSVKTPVVSTFAPSSIAPPPMDETPSPDTQELVIDPLNDDQSLSDISTPNTESPSPLSASLEVGERAFGETHSYIVMAPSGSRDTTITNVLEQHNALQDENNGVQNSTQIKRESPVEATLALGISVPSEERGSTETVSIPIAGSQSTPVAEKSSVLAQSSGSGSSRRRSPPAPLSIHDKQYSEPSMDLKTGPKSFHAVVHGKKTQAASAIPYATLPRTPRAQVVTMPQRVSSSMDPCTPGSPDLSALVAQAMYLEQRLMGGDNDAPTPKVEVIPAQPSETQSDAVSMADTSRISFPSSDTRHEEFDEAANCAPTPPPKSPNPQVLAQPGNGSRKSWSWSSENTSSEDSVPVLTPPSPTFDLNNNSPLFYEPSIASGIGEHGERSEHGDDESRKSISSILSSPGRSARKKVLSMSRSNTVLGRMLSRAGRSNSTLELPDEVALDPMQAGDFASISASHSDMSIHVPSPSRSTITQMSGLSLPRSKHNTPDVPRPVSVLSNMSASGYSVTTTTATASPLDVNFFDSFPDVPSSMPPSFEREREQVYGLGIELENNAVEESDPQSPPPPTPPSKSPVLRGFALPQIELQPQQSVHPPPPFPLTQSPPPPAPPSKSPSASSLSLSSSKGLHKSKSILRLPHLPYRSTSQSPDVGTTHAPSSFPHSSSSIFATISRSISGRTRSRVSSNASRSSGGYGSSS